MLADKVLVTGSSGHLGEALVRTLLARGSQVVAVDARPSAYTTHVGSIADPAFIADCVKGCGKVFHSASLHKRHLSTRAPRDFIEVNVTGTLCLLEAAASAGVSHVVYASTTSVHGTAFKPAPAEPAVMVDEALCCVPKNIYGVTKKTAEDLCELFARTRGLACTVLRAGRFYPEPDSADDLSSDGVGDLNGKVNDFLSRRLDLADAVEAHILAAQAGRTAGFRRYVLSATSPFSREHASRLRHDAAGLLRELVPEHEALFVRLGWSAPRSIGRVYCNDLARRELQWVPRFDFRTIVARLQQGAEPFSELSRLVGCKGY